MSILGIGPTLVRLAWHASGTYSKEDGTGGSYGSTMRYSPEKEWGANAGLQLGIVSLEKMTSRQLLIIIIVIIIIIIIIIISYNNHFALFFPLSSRFPRANKEEVSRSFHRRHMDFGGVYRYRKYGWPAD